MLALPVAESIGRWTPVFTPHPGQPLHESYWVRRQTTAVSGGPGTPGRWHTPRPQPGTSAQPKATWPWRFAAWAPSHMGGAYRGSRMGDLVVESSRIRERDTHGLIFADMFNQQEFAEAQS